MGFIDELHRYVNYKLPDLPIFTWIAANFVVPYWARRTPVKRLPGGPRYSAMQPIRCVSKAMSSIQRSVRTRVSVWSPTSLGSLSSRSA